MNAFDIYSKRNRRGNRGGVKEKPQALLKLKEAQRFIDNYNISSDVSLSTDVTGIAVVKRGSEKTNPNVWIKGANQEYIALEGLNIAKERNFSTIESQYGANVAVIGSDIVKTLFNNY